MQWDRGYSNNYGGGAYEPENRGGWEYDGNSSTMRRGDSFQEDQYGQYSNEYGQYDTGGPQYDSGYDSAALQATMMQMISSMHQAAHAANSVPVSRGPSMMPDPQKRADHFERPPIRDMGPPFRDVGPPFRDAGPPLRDAGRFIRPPPPSRPPAPDASSNSVDPCKIYVTGLQLNATKDVLGSAFASCGIIKEAFVVGGKGYGFVTFDTPEAANQACKMSGRNFGGSILNVTLAKPKPQKNLSSQRERSRSPNRGGMFGRGFQDGGGERMMGGGGGGWDAGRSWGLPSGGGMDWNAGVPAFRGGPAFGDRMMRGPPVPGMQQSFREPNPGVDVRGQNREIVRFYRLRELMRFVRENVMNFNTVNTGTAFYQLGMLAKKTKGKAKDEPLDPAVVEVLSSHALYMCSEFDPHSLTNVFWGFANMGLCPKPPLTPALFKRAVATLPNFKPQSVAMFMWALSKLSLHPPAEVATGLLKRATAVCPEFTPNDTSNFLGGLSKLGLHPPPALVAALEKRVVEVSVQLKALDLSNVVGCFTSMGLPLPPSLADALTKRCKSLASEFSASAMASFLWAFVKLGASPTAEVLAPLMQKAVLPEVEVDLTSLATTLWALGKMGRGEYIAALEERALAELGKKVDGELTHPSVLAELLWGLGQLGRVLAPDVAERLNRRALALRTEFKPAEMAAFLWGCARLGVTSDPEVFKYFLDRLAVNVAYLKADDVANVVGCFALLGLDSQAEVTDKLVKHAVTLSTGFSPEDLARFLWSLATLNYACSELPHFVQAAGGMMERMAPAEKALMHQFFLSCAHEEKLRACCTAQVQDLVKEHGAACRACFEDSTFAANEVLAAAVSKCAAEVGQPAEHPAQDETSGYSMHAQVLDGSSPKGCAVLFEGRRGYIQLSSGVRVAGGAAQLKRRQLAALGYRVVTVAFWEWDECSLLGSAAQQSYLSNLLRLRPK